MIPFETNGKKIYWTGNDYKMGDKKSCDCKNNQKTVDK